MRRSYQYMKYLSTAMVAITAACAPHCVKADFYAAQNGQTPTFPYSSWASAANTIQDAVNAATPNATVWVGAGRYTLPPNATNYYGSNVVFVNRPLILRSSNGVPETTVIDGQGTNRGLAVSYSSPSITNRFILDGFTISNCWAWGTNSGGGILLDPLNTGWTNIIQNCIVADNTVFSPTQTVTAAGGGLYCSMNFAYFGLIISNSIFRNNQATNADLKARSMAGAIYSRTAGTRLITDSVIENNTAGYAGGIYTYLATLEINRSVLRGNVAHSGENATWAGGAIYLGASQLVLRNSLLYDNWTVAAGGAIASQCQAKGAYIARIYNSTIVSNYAGGGGGGIYMRSWGALGSMSIHMFNSIVHSNGPQNAFGNMYLAGLSSFATNYITNSCFWDTNAVWTGTGNTTNSPAFADFAGRNFRLSPLSPCLNTGTNDAWMEGSVDLDSNRRIRYGSVDMGAYEMIKSSTIYRFR